MKPNRRSSFQRQGGISSRIPNTSVAPDYRALALSRGGYKQTPTVSPGTARLAQVIRSLNRFPAKRFSLLQVARERLLRVTPRSRKISPVSMRVRDPLKVQIRFPAGVRICIQRKQRKEVLFAKNIAGSRGGSPGRRSTYRRTPNSYYRC